MVKYTYLKVICRVTGSWQVSIKIGQPKISNHEKNITDFVGVNPHFSSFKTKIICYNIIINNDLKKGTLGIKQLVQAILPMQI